MRKVYLFVYSSTVASREDINNFLNTCGMVVSWRYDINNSYYILSDYSAADLSSEIRSKFPKGRFIITEMSEHNRQGWLTKESWEFMKKKQ
jgi:hypothetical protein